MLHELLNDKAFALREVPLMPCRIHFLAPWPDIGADGSGNHAEVKAKHTTFIQYLSVSSRLETVS